MSDRRQRKIADIMQATANYTPSPERIKAIRVVMDQYRTADADKDSLERAARELDRAAYVFRLPISDTAIDAELEREYSIEPVRRMGELAAEMLALFNDPRIQRTALCDGHLRDGIESVSKTARIVQSAMTRRNFPGLEKQKGDPQSKRYMLYVALMVCWYVCQRADRIPRRQGGGDSGRYPEFLLKLLDAVDIRSVNIDEAHKAMQRMDQSSP